MTLAVIVPTRGRPEHAAELQRTFAETTHADTLLVFSVDEDDPDLQRYRDAVDDVHVGKPGNPGMVWALNRTAHDLEHAFDHLGFMGDDHRPRTDGWDVQIVQAIEAMGTGITYGNDLFQGADLPTAVFMSSDIVRAIGFMAPPEFRHMYVDSAWLAWGQGAGCLRYLPDVIIEHVHPHAGKAEVDEGYSRVWPLQEEERETWETYVRDRLDGDVDKIRGLRAS